ncbi:MAG: hypothetical protein AAGF26_15655 [Cyanobacteria bacterium P01_G01_bin.49]
MSDAVSIQQVIEDFETLPTEDQDFLLELIHKRRIEKKRTEIARNATQTLTAIETGKAKRGTLADLRADLLEEE